MKKVPIFGSKGSDPPPGSPGCANYMVTIPHDQAGEEREKWMARTEKKKMTNKGEEFANKSLTVMKHLSGQDKAYETELPAAEKKVVVVVTPPPDAILPQEPKKEERKDKDIV